MCKSHAEGGKRCAADTRPAYQAAIAQVASATTESARNDVRSAVTESVVSHASTRTGAKEVADLRGQATRDGDVAQQWWLQHCEDRGAQQREVDEMIEQKLRERNDERAAAQTRPAYEAALERLNQCTTEGGRNMVREEQLASMVNHAATKKGAAEVAALREQAARSGDIAQEWWLKHCETKAVEKRQVDADMRRLAREHGGAARTAPARTAAAPRPRTPEPAAAQRTHRTAPTESSLGSWGDYVPASYSH